MVCQDCIGKRIDCCFGHSELTLARKRSLRGKQWIPFGGRGRTERSETGVIASEPTATRGNGIDTHKPAIGIGVDNESSTGAFCFCRQLVGSTTEMEHLHEC